MDSDGIAPRWAWVGLGFLLVRAALGIAGARATPPPGPRVVAPPPDLSVLSARELRRIPGIGPRRALAIVRARWEAAPEGFSLRSVPGIGPALERRVIEWIEGRGGTVP